MPRRHVPPVNSVSTRSVIDGVAAVRALVNSWSARLSLEIPLERWRTISTDGWSIFGDDDCLATRLPMTETVAVSARPYRDSRRDLIDAIERELVLRGIQCVRLVPYRCLSADPWHFEAAWQKRQDAGFGYVDLGRDVASAWLDERDMCAHYNYLDASVHDGGIFAAGHCIVAASRSPVVVLVSAKKYRPGGSPLSSHRFSVRRALRAALAGRGAIVRDVTPMPPPGRDPGVLDLLEAWERERPRIEPA